MKFAIALFDPPPFPRRPPRAALQRSRAGRRHEIVRLFFYQDGVHSASANVVSGQDEFDLPAAWRELVERNGLDAVVCIAAALRRGVLNAEEAERYGRPGANLGAPWELSGLGQLHEAAQSADRLVCFEATDEPVAADHQPPVALVRPERPRGAGHTLTGGAFDLPVGMLFLDDGAFQLAPGQHPAHLQQKDLQANLQALPMFGVDDLYVSARSLRERGLAEERLALAVEVLDDQALRDLLQRYDQVITL